MVIPLTGYYDTSVVMPASRPGLCQHHHIVYYHLLLHHDVLAARKVGVTCRVGHLCTDTKHASIGCTLLHVQHWLQFTTCAEEDNVLTLTKQMQLHTHNRYNLLLANAVEEVSRTVVKNNYST